MDGILVTSSHFTKSASAASSVAGTGVRSTTQCQPKTSPSLANEPRSVLTFRVDPKEAARRHQSGQLLQLRVHRVAAYLSEFDLFDQVPTLEISLGFGWGDWGHKFMILRRSSSRCPGIGVP